MSEEKIDSDDADKVVEEDPLTALKKQHKAETKALQDQILAAKKNINKTDKKKKKELNAWIATEEAKLKTKHDEELKALENQNSMASLSLNDAGAEVDDLAKNASSSKRMSKAEKRREKKAQLDKEREERIALAEAEDDDGDRSLEDKAMCGILLDKGLKPKSVLADGDCLFRAISHQLSLTGEDVSVADLRKKTADVLRADPKHFSPFVDINSGEGGFLEYCDRMEKTPAWGGHIELEAMSKVLGREIEVLQASGPPLTFGEGNPPLVIAYYRHAFGLGEHYDSTEPI